MRIHRNSRRNFLLAAFALLVAAIFVSSSLAAPGHGERGPLDKPQGKSAAGPSQRKTQLEAWKKARAARDGRSPSSALAFGGTAAVGRPSMAINSTGSIVYTKQFAGSSCDVDPSEPTVWNPSTAYSANDVVNRATGSGNFFFRATNAGTSGAVEPAWPSTFGSTVVDGTITWQALDQQWTASRTYPAGTTLKPQVGFFEKFGFNFQATTGGTTGVTEPQWPTVPGATVTDGTVVWKAIGYFPGSFRGCDAMQLVLRASGGAETILDTEGEAIGAAGTQLSGWAEFYALNNLGQAAFREAVVARLSDADESGSGIAVSGPGPGITEIAVSNTTINGRGVCGFGPMVAINDSGQVSFDGLTTALPLWQPNHAFAANTTIIPTNGLGVPFKNPAAGTSGATEPVWPQTITTSVTDGTITWNSQVPESGPRYCAEDQHGLHRFTPGSGTVLFMAIGTDVGGGTTVVGFGNDVVPASGTCSTCSYEEVDGFLNSSGHASVAVRLSTDDTAAYLLTGQLAFTQVARTGGAGPGGTFGRIYSRTELNASDQVLFKAAVGGVDKMLRWTGPATYATVASVGDDIGTREGGAATGETMVELGGYGDINASGNAVIQATLSDGPHAYYFWDSLTGHLTEIARDDAVGVGGITTGKAARAARATAALVILPHNLSPEMVTLNDSNVAAFTSGAGDPEQPEEGSELTETGLHTWTLIGGVQNQIRNGDTVNGFSVTGVQAQHPSFRRRQLNSAGCVATQFLANGADAEDAAEGSPSPRDQGVPPGPQLFVSCSQQVIPTPTVTSTPPPNATPTPIPTGNPGAAAGIPTLSTHMLALFGLALAAAASLILLVRKR